MEITKNNIGATGLLVKPEGRIDINTATEFSQLIEEEIDDLTNLVIDFENIVYISSIGLRILLEFQKNMSTHGSMKIINVNEEIMNIFKMTGFDKILTIV